MSNEIWVLLLQDGVVKPCPICGGDAQVRRDYVLHIRCINSFCGIRLDKRYPWAQDDHTTNDVLIKNWNELPRDPCAKMLPMHEG